MFFYISRRIPSISKRSFFQPFNCPMRGFTPLEKSVREFYGFSFFLDFLIDFFDFFVDFFNKVYVIFLVLYPSAQCVIFYHKNISVHYVEKRNHKCFKLKGDKGRRSRKAREALAGKMSLSLWTFWAY